MKVKILGKTWKLSFCPQIEMGKLLGSCDHPSKKGKEIYVLDSLVGKQVADTVIHECLHCSAFDVLGEEYIDRVSTDLAEIVFSEGVLRRVLSDPETLEMIRGICNEHLAEDQRTEGSSSDSSGEVPVGRKD